MKKFIIVAFAAMLTFCLFGCGANNSNEKDQQNEPTEEIIPNDLTNEVGLNGVLMKVSPEWENLTSEKGALSFAPSFNSFITTTTYTDGTTSDPQKFIDSILKDSNAEVYSSIENNNGTKWNAISCIHEDSPNMYYLIGSDTNGIGLAISVMLKDNASNPTNIETMHNFFDSVSFSSQEIRTAELENTMTPDQKNAYNLALSYLSSNNFSHEGLVKQLEYEGFNHNDAVFAADNCGADWNQQAAEMAASYLSFSSFSRSGLIDQLEYEGFTSDQAKYGVDQAYK